MSEEFKRLKEQHEKYKDKTMAELIKERNDRLAEGQKKLRKKYKQYLVEDEIEEEVVYLKQAEKAMHKLYYNAKAMCSVDEFKIEEESVGEPEAEFRAYQLKKIALHLQQAVKLYDYIDTPIKMEGTLSKRKDGQYAIKDTDIYFNNGDKVEYWDDGCGTYEISQFEMRDGEYCIVGNNRSKLEGLKVRIRGLD